MRKKLKPTGLFRKKPLTSKSDEFRVISIDTITNEILVQGIFPSLQEAQQKADSLKNQKSNLDAYVQGQQNRVIYRA